MLKFNSFTIQSVVTLAIGLAFYFYQGSLATQAALYGGCMIIFNVWLTNRRMRAADEIAKIAPGKEVTVFYVAAVQRFIYTLGFFIFGMGLLKLPPVPMITTFTIVYLTYLIISKE